MRDRRLWRWVRRYAPAEVGAVIGAVLGALLGARLAGVGGAAVGGDVGEGVAFYAVVVARELRADRSATRPRSRRRLLADLLSTRSRCARWRCTPGSTPPATW